MDNRKQRYNRQPQKRQSKEDFKKMQKRGVPRCCGIFMMVKRKNYYFGKKSKPRYTYVCKKCKRVV